jgi:hypothetical protein
MLLSCISATKFLNLFYKRAGDFGFNAAKGHTVHKEEILIVLLLLLVPSRCSSSILALNLDWPVWGEIFVTNIKPVPLGLQISLHFLRPFQVIGLASEDRDRGEDGAGSGHFD